MQLLKVTEEAWPYLVAQRGALDDMREDQVKWVQHYRAAIESEFIAIRSYLPNACRTLLDVGAGMGGIDALLNWHYGGHVKVILLDGIEDVPTVQKHNRTFNSMAIAERFLMANGVEYFASVDANDSGAQVGELVDVVVSFKSWCFHIEPKRYIDRVRLACHPGTQLFIDVRRGRDDWIAELDKAFIICESVYAGRKHSCLRMVPR